MDRIITIQSVSYASSDYSDEDEPTWSDYLASVPSSLIQSKGSEQIENNQRVAENNYVWEIIYPNNKTIDNTMRVVYDSKNYYITNIKEIGLRKKLQIATEERDNG